MARSAALDPLLLTIDRLSGATVGVVGDLVADLYVSGLTDRVSREAPVLIVQYEEERLRPGGAANVAANITALGAKACVVGVIGEDEIGYLLINHLEDDGKGAQCNLVIAAKGRSTITKTRFLAGAKLTSRQQVLRLDRQPTSHPDAKLLANIAGHVRDLDRKVDAWVVSDYGYGGFDEPICQLLGEIAGRKPVVADSRFHLARFRGLTVVKPNEEEASATAAELEVNYDDPSELARALAAALDAKAALVTLGNQGMILGRGSQSMHIPAVGGEEIVDLTGAGDSVAATLTAALAVGADLEIAARLSNHAGAIVVMKEGAATASPEELRNSVKSREPA